MPKALDPCVTGKTCTKCGEHKACDSFSKRSAMRDGLHSRCRDCDSQMKAAWFAAHPGYNQAYYRANRERNLEKSQMRSNSSKYGLRAGRFEEMLLEQDHRCACCGDELSRERRKFSIDHDHSCCPRQGSCGQCVRGIICQACNIAVGHVENGRAALAKIYLERA